jgi:hypothetical protein
LTTTLRETLLSQFTAWNKRLVDTNQAAANYIDVKIEAGRTAKTTPSGTSPASLSVVFKGQVVLCTPVSSPPSIGVRITCYTRQIDRTTFISAPAAEKLTFAQYVAWAAAQMGFGTSQFVCDTTYNDVEITNPGRSIMTVSGLLIDIQNQYRPDVAAFVDDDYLIVKDRNKIIDTSVTANLTEFVDIPQWTEWGIEFTALFDPTVRLAHAATVTSKMNPSLNGQYVVMELEYDLASRKDNFYVKANANPPA